MDDDLSPPEEIKALLAAVLRITRFLKVPQPGVPITMFAIISVAYTVLVERPSLTVKTAYIFSACLLAGVEIIAIYRERDRQNKDYLEMQERQNQTHLQQMQAIGEMQQTAESKHDAVVRLLLAGNDPAEGLKKRALELSESLLNFVYERMQHAPKQPLYYMMGGSNWPNPRNAPNLVAVNFQQEMQEMMEETTYRANTTQMFKDRFSKQIVQIKNEFSTRGLVDKQLEAACSAVSYATLRIIAERLGVLAEQLEPKSQIVV